MKRIFVVFLVLIGACVSVWARRGTEMKQQPKYVFSGLSADQKLSFGTEWGFMGFIDPDSYQNDLGGPRRPDGSHAWTPELVLKHAIEVMNHQQGYFWGCGEVEARIVINPSNYEELKQRAVVDHKGFVQTIQGRLCLTGDDRLTMAAQYPEDWRPPMSIDAVWAVPSGWYSVEVLQMFKYNGSDQAPGDQDARFESMAIHYAIRIVSVEKPPLSKFAKIPIQPSYYKP